jgi:hypothetical protein
MKTALNILAGSLFGGVTGVVFYSKELPIYFAYTLIVLFGVIFLAILALSIIAHFTDRENIGKKIVLFVEIFCRLLIGEIGGIFVFSICKGNSLTAFAVFFYCCLGAFALNIFSNAHIAVLEMD